MKNPTSKDIREDLVFIIDNTKKVLARFTQLQEKAIKMEAAKLKKAVDEHNKNHKA